VSDFEAAVGGALRRVPEDELVALAAVLAAGAPVSAAWAGAAPDRVAAIVASIPSYPDGPRAAAAYLRGAAAGYARRRREQRVQVVWGGPVVHGVPTRGMGQVLAELIGRAEASLLLMTYSAKAYPLVLTALSQALARDVRVSIVVETLEGAGSAISGPEPAAAFAGLAAVELWHWPKKLRPTSNAKMHAKIAIADRRELLVSSANLTASGIDQSMEAGILITGGEAPRRAAAQIENLMSNGTLIQLR
jgi:phosphatidylserine/phosphatidylglycerophosphate/cardiolipin synthase-like enzyme